MQAPSPSIPRGSRSRTCWRTTRASRQRRTRPCRRKAATRRPREPTTRIRRKKNATSCLTSPGTATKRPCRPPVHVESQSTRGAIRSGDLRGRVSTRRKPILRVPGLTGNRSGIVSWMFRSRTTGRITLAQLPNWLLAVWLLASAVMWLGHPQGWVHAVLLVLASAALALWAGDEVLRGVNPFRRLLGLAVLAWLGSFLVRLWLTT